MVEKGICRDPLANGLSRVSMINRLNESNEKKIIWIYPPGACPNEIAKASTKLLYFSNLVN